MCKLLTGFIDVLFPPSADQLTVRRLTSDTWQAVYHPGIYRNYTYLSHYQHPLVQAVIKENKFHHNTKAAQLLASLLLAWPLCSHKDTVFIPIPLGKKRQLDRGHNQVHSVLRAAGLLDRTVATLLQRSLETAPQSQLPKEERKRNIQQAFRVREDHVPLLQPYTQILLLDDVVTTGATMEAAKAALLPHVSPSTKIHCVALAH